LRECNNSPFYYHFSVIILVSFPSNVVYVPQANILFIYDLTTSVLAPVDVEILRYESQWCLGILGFMRHDFHLIIPVPRINCYFT